VASLINASKGNSVSSNICTSLNLAFLIWFM